METRIFRVPEDFLAKYPTCGFLGNHKVIGDLPPPLARKSLELFDWLSWQEMRVVSLCVFGETPIEQK